MPVTCLGADHYYYPVSFMAMAARLWPSHPDNTALAQRMWEAMSKAMLEPKCQPQLPPLHPSSPSFQHR